MHKPKRFKFGYFYDPVDHGDDRQQQQMRTLAAWIHVHVHASIRAAFVVYLFLLFMIFSKASRHVPHRAVINNVENRSHLTHTRSLWPYQHQDRITQMPQHND
ncbi:hypothetical protein T11_16543 [Trichinella zimbabwensis]|uniref:Uncharacterized protein n=1 Tax=Trichinella zimbabwensis TaxID=268475 RepID=A0A0V1GZC1_9BILA|nr:hypothetical protein T11_16543 [Trichinella zimbabwensis]